MISTNESKNKRRDARRGALRGSDEKVRSTPGRKKIKAGAEVIVEYRPLPNTYAYRFAESLYKRGYRDAPDCWRRFRSYACEKQAMQAVLALSRRKERAYEYRLVKSDGRTIS